MELIGNAEISAILSRAWIAILCLKNALFVGHFGLIIFFERHPPNGIHGKRFISGIEFVEVHARTYAIIVDSLMEARSLRVKVALATHVMALLLAHFQVVLPWTWHLLLPELFYLSEPIRRRMEAGRHRLAHLCLI